jgi:tRNA nucleotidyltransferase (CCA-adding enzyme)
MQTPVLFVEPLSAIGDTLARLGDRPGAARPESATMAGYRDEGVLYVARQEDLGRMAAMGLEHLPMACIAVAQPSPFRRDDAPVAGQITGTPDEPATCDYARRLTAYFPVYFVAALYELQSLMMKADMKGYVIGGMARDLLQFDEKRLSVKDVDITVEGDALLLARFLTENSRNFALVEEFPEFGTAKVRYKDSLMLDFASTRREVYPHCGALPVVLKRGVPLQEDVIRRDFTMNALALSIHPLGRMLDHTHGLEDLQSRHVHILHPASFFEDPSRILRALKFCARFDFELSPDTRQLIMHFLRWGAKAGYKGGGERIKQELKAFLNIGESPAKSRWLAFFLESGCVRLLNMETESALPESRTDIPAGGDLAALSPGSPLSSPATLPFGELGALRARLAGIAEVLPMIESALSTYAEEAFAFETYLCLIFRDYPEHAFRKTVQRLGLTKQERDVVEHFRRVKETIRLRFEQVHDLSSPADIYDLFHGLPLMTVVACLAELSLHSETRMRTVLEAFVRYKRKWENLRLELNGNDLINLGVPEGKDVGRLLNELLHAKLAGQLPDRLAEINAVRRALGDFSPPGSSLPAEGGAPSPSLPPPIGVEFGQQAWEKGSWPDVAPPVA